MITSLLHRLFAVLCVSFAFFSGAAFADHYEGSVGMSGSNYTAVLEYYAVDTDASPTTSETVGVYETERDARRAARKAAREANDFMSLDCPDGALC